MRENNDRVINEMRCRLREMRHIAGFTQKEVEDATGISQPLLSAFESGRRELGISDILSLCSLYKCSAAFIFGETETQSPELCETSLSKALALEQQLSAPLDENEKKLCDTFIRLYIYKAIRSLYLSNPRHKKSMLFGVTDEQVSKALERSLNDLQGELPARLSVKPACAKRIELGEEYSAALREFISSTEATIDPARDLT